MENNAGLLKNAVKGDLTIDDIKQGVPLYHRPKNSGSGDPLAVVKSLMKYGFSREYDGDNGGGGRISMARAYIPFLT